MKVLVNVVLYVALLLASTTVALASHGCAGVDANRVVRVTVVSAGAALQSLTAEHQRAYRAATDALIARLHAADAGVGAYDTEVAPLDAAFHLRGDALATVSAGLYATATIHDAARAGGDLTAVREAAANTLRLLEEASRVLLDGRVLPGVTIPPVVTEALELLRRIVGVPHPEVVDASA